MGWKSDIPTFLSFLFKEDMYFKDIVKSILKDTGEATFHDEIGYKCTAGESINILNDLGYDFAQIIDVYTFFYNKLIENVEEDIFYRIAEKYNDLSDDQLNLKFKEHISSFTKLNKKDEFLKFCEILPNILKETQEEPYVNLVFLDFENIRMYFFEKELHYPPWALLFSEILNTNLLHEYNEILTMFHIRLFLEIVPSDSIVRLDLYDIIKEEKEAKEIHLELTTRLIGKIKLYNNFFEPLITKEDFIKEKFIKDKGKELLNSCLKEKDIFKKGQLLETFIKLVFTSNKSLNISSSRVKTGDEEIDLVILNKTDTAFWISFGSMFFVECKNWNKPIGSKEMRDFETKLRNHSNVTSLGLIVSINGFTTQAINHLKRIGREKYHIVPIDRKNLEEYLIGKLRLFEWLENLVKVIY